MFKLLESYITRTILMSAGLVCLIMSAILFLINLLGEFKAIGDGDYGILQAFFYVCMRLPQGLYHFSPMILLVSVLAGLSLLVSYRELTIMRTTGMSRFRLLKSIFFAAVMLTLFMTLIGEIAGPHLSYKALMNKENSRTAGQAVVTTRGVWFHLDHNFIHVQTVINRHLLKQVTLYEFNPIHQLKTVYYANTLEFKNHRWTMYEGKLTRFLPQETKNETFSIFPIDLKINDNLLTVGIVDPDEMSLSRLYSFSTYLENNDLQATQYRFVFWKRVFQPLAALIMILLAIPFVLQIQKQNKLGSRIFIGILFGVVFFMLNTLLGQMSILFQFSPLAGALFPIILFAIIGIFLTSYHKT